MSNKTMTEIEHDAIKLESYIKEASAMAKKLSKALAETRNTLEALKPFSHPSFKKSDNIYQISHITNSAEKEILMKDIIVRQIEAINQILGDRA